MRNVLLMIKNNFSRNILAVVLVAAGIFILAACLNAGTLVSDTFKASRIPVGVISKETSALSQDLETYLTDVLDMEIIKDASDDELTDLLINKRISAIIEVPESFEKSVIEGNIRKLSYTALDDYENVAFLEIYLDTYMEKVQLLSQAAKGDKTVFLRMLQASLTDVSQMKATDETQLLQEQQKEGFVLSAGVFLMFAMGISAVIALTVFDDKRLGTYSRMQISPVKPIEYITGTTIFGVFIEWIFALGFLIIAAVNRTQTGVPIWLMGIILMLYTLFCVGLSLVVALIVKSRAVIFTFAIGGTTLLCILGGAWFPVEQSNALLAKIAALTPQYWFMELIRNIQKNPEYDFLPGIIMLTLFAALTYLISAALFTKKQQ